MNFQVRGSCIKLTSAPKAPISKRSDNQTPAVILKPHEPLRRGWHEAKFRILGKEVVSPKLYFDQGAGFSEAHSINLCSSAGEPFFEAKFFLTSDTDRLRFDPNNEGGRFDITQMEIRRLGSIGAGLMLAQHAFRVAKVDPLRLIVRMGKYRKYLKDPHFFQMQPPVKGLQGSYERWREKYDYHPETDREKLKLAVSNLGTQPKISILMPVYNTPIRFLDAAIQSCINQMYKNWELCIADDCSTDPQVHERLKHWKKTDDRIKVTFRRDNGHISKATNSAFELVNSDWVALFDHDDLLSENALGEIALEINKSPGAEIIYSDEDKVNDNGIRERPHFKPKYSRELFRSYNYFNHLTVHRTKNIQKVGKWRTGFEGSQDYDLNLRIVEQIAPENIRHIPKILYHWRAVKGSAAIGVTEKPYAYDAGKRALQDHLRRTKTKAKIKDASGLPHYRLVHAIPKPEPFVSLIIPTKDKLELLSGCVDSIRSRTSYNNYEIVIVDNNSRDSKTLSYLSDIECESNVRVVKYDQPFNFSAINNFAVEKAKGSLIGLINNDIEVISTNWLSEMVAWAKQPDIGCVGAKLYYADDTIQHAGVILGIGGVAGHSHKYFPRTHKGYAGRLKLVQNLSAVTGACLLIKKEIYREVNGMDEMNLAIAFNDVDLCLKVRSAGYDNVWTPYAELFHLESISRGRDSTPEQLERFNNEVRFMAEKWGNILTSDPYYSPNLTLERETFGIKS